MASRQQLNVGEVLTYQVTLIEDPCKLQLTSLSCGHRINVTPSYHILFIEQRKCLITVKFCEIWLKSLWG